MANGGLITLGIIIIIGMFFFTNILVTPQQKQQIELARSVCGFQLFGIPLGQIGQALSPDVAESCRAASSYSQIASFELPAYILGFILIVIGLAIGGRKEITREIIREPKEKFEISRGEWEEFKKYWKKPEKEVKETKPKTKYCSNCGTKVKGKFCSKCGEPV